MRAVFQCHRFSVRPHRRPITTDVRFQARFAPKKAHGAAEAANKPITPLSLPERLKEIVTFIIDDDKGGKILYGNTVNGFHPQFGVFQ
jgi:hypothetical protein